MIYTITYPPAPSTLEADCLAVLDLLAEHRYRTNEQIMKKCKLTKKQWFAARQALWGKIGWVAKDGYTLI